MSFSSDIKDEILENLEKLSSNKGKDVTKLLDLIKFGEIITEINSLSDFNQEFSMYSRLLNISNINIDEITYVLSGMFLGSGSITDPKKDYHFELVFKSKYFLDYATDLLSFLEFTPRYIKRKLNKTTTYVLYLKEADQISLFLSVIKAMSAMLLFEQIRVEKDVKNNINRGINCETANLSKTIKASLIQVQAIEKLQSIDLFFKLDDELKYIANLRMKNKEASLAKLSLLSKEDNKFFTKTTIKRKLDKIIEISDKY